MKKLKIKNFYSVWFTLILLAVTDCGWTNKDGTVIDENPLSDLNGMISFTVSEGSWSPEFSAIVTDYDVEVASNDGTQVGNNITATTLIRI